MTAFEQAIYDMSEAEYDELLKRILAHFPTEIDWLVVWRYCSKCKGIRPPRAHHCAICGKCVLRMDHHCPWVGNCVGLYNHKHFIMFLLHAIIGNLIVFGVISADISTSSFSGAITKVEQMLTYVLSGTLAFCLLCFMCMHLYFICTSISLTWLY